MSRYVKERTVVTMKMPIGLFIFSILLWIGIGIAIGSIIFGCAPAVNRSSVHVRASNTRALEPGGMTDAACLDLMDRRDGAQLAGKILAGVGGVSALATAPESVPEGARWGIGAGAATTAAVSVGVLWYGEMKSDEFERYCEVAEEDETAPPDDASKIAPNPFVDGGVE